MPDILEIHTSPELVEKWIKYGALDSELTFLLFHTFRLMMTDLPVEKFGMKTTWDLYQKYWLSFGELLTEIERRGIGVNKSHLEVR